MVVSPHINGVYVRSLDGLDARECHVSTVTTRNDDQGSSPHVLHHSFVVIRTSTHEISAKEIESLTVHYQRGVHAHRLFGDWQEYSPVLQPVCEV